MPSLGGGELVFILVIVLIVFGAGKLPDIFGQLGKGMRSFRDESTKAEEAGRPTASAATGTSPAGTAGAVVGTPAGGTRYCASCGKPQIEDAKFCASCGASTPVA